MNSLKILTLNVGMLEIDVPLLRTITIVKKKNLRIHAVIHALKNSDYDIVLLQEIGGSLLKKLLHELKNIFPYHATHHVWKLFSYNLLILSKLPLEETHFVPFKNQTHFESWGVTKGLLCATVTWDNTPYHLITTHLVGAGTKSGDNSPKTLSVRNAQIHQMKEYVRTHYGKNDIVIIGGDFNAGPLSCQENYDVIVDELYDVMQHVPEHERVTWTTKNPLIRKSTKADPDKQIDGFYMHHHHYEQLKNGIGIQRKFMEEIEFLHPKGIDKVMLSDHYGVEMIINKNTA